MGMVRTPEDSLAPSQAKQQHAPKSMLEEIRIKPSDTLENK